MGVSVSFSKTRSTVGKKTAASSPTGGSYQPTRYEWGERSTMGRPLQKAARKQVVLTWHTPPPGPRMVRSS